MFKHRLTKFGISSFIAMFMLFIGGSLQSCKDWLDVYPYDDPGDPEWLGSSVYDFLKEGTPNHTYSHFVAIIDSLGETETLSYTGSKTLLVADDEAFERFFSNNDWVSRNGEKGVKSLSEMTKAQMKTILYNSMLDNAMLLDMLSSTSSDEGTEGTCLRRLSSAAVIDTIPLIDDSNWPAYNHYWDVIRGKDRTDGIRLAMDGTNVMLVHFLNDYLKKQNIKASDIAFLFKKKGNAVKTFTDGDAFIYGNKIVSNDVNTGSYSDDKLTIICKNGYLYRMDELLIPPMSMAGEIRKHPDTRIFSHMLDRFCVPEYSKELSDKYLAKYKVNEKIYRLRYFTSEYTAHDSLTKAKVTLEESELLNYDPGNNSLKEKDGVASDMAAMFVPTDEAMYEYFSPEGAGYFLLTNFAPDVEVTDYESLMSALDCVPQTNIALIINNLMKLSFKETVLSNFNKIMDDANEPMGIDSTHVDECVVANNGVIYILNKAFGPATYESVYGPTTVLNNMTIIKTVIEQLRYDYYLLAMDARYTFIVPEDAHFLYYDPLTLTADKAKLYSFHYDTNMPKQNGAKKFWANVYQFDPATYEIVDTLTEESWPVPVDKAQKPFNGIAQFAANRMEDLMEYLIIVHDAGEDIFTSHKKYFMTKGYGTIKVDKSNHDAVKFYGGEQLENGTYVVSSTTSPQKNGVTFSTVPGQENTPTRLYTSIPTPPTRSVYDNMKMHPQFSGFFNLCYPGEDYASNDSAVSTLRKVFKIKTANSQKELYDSAKQYSIFYTQTLNPSKPKEKGRITDYTKNTVPFFNIYHYTVYAPSNDAINEVIDLGLPTWEQVDTVVNTGRNLKAASMLRSIIEFAKYHFQDNSVYVDNEIASKNYTSAVINPKTNRFYELQVKSDGNSFTVEGEVGGPRRVILTTDDRENKDWNIMCRDNVYTSKTTGMDAELELYSSSSFAVLQPIDGALLNKNMLGYDGRFKRFADNGATVDIMYVDGTGNTTIGGVDYYLVANVGNVRVTGIEGIEADEALQETHRVAYLMTPIDETEAGHEWSYTREKLLEEKVSVNGKWEYLPILVSDEGFQIKEIEEKVSGKVVKSYVYKTTEKNGIIYKVKLDCNGKIKEEIPVGKVTPEEGGENN